MSLVASPAPLALQNGRQLLVSHSDGCDRLEIIGADGRPVLTLELGPAGPVLRLEGDLTLQTGGDLRLKARNLAFEATGEFHVQAGGDLHATARQHHITADLGNVNVRANDDVRLNGERVMVNCP